MKEKEKKFYIEKVGFLPLFPSSGSPSIWHIIKTELMKENHKPLAGHNRTAIIPEYFFLREAFLVDPTSYSPFISPKKFRQLRYCPELRRKGVHLGIPNCCSSLLIRFSRVLYLSSEECLFL